MGIGCLTQMNKSRLTKLVQEYLIRDSRDASNLLFNENQVEDTESLSKSMIMPPSFFHRLFEGASLPMQIKETGSDWKTVPTTLSIDDKGTILIQLDDKVIPTL